jgi:chorismate mutase/prephenate dehydratase
MTPRTLEALRAAIDSLDDQLLDRLNERAQLVKEVGALKSTLQQPAFVPGREAQIIDRLSARNTGPFPHEAIRPVFAEIISACLSLEQPIQVAFLGPEATFTHMAARARFGLSARYVPTRTIAAVFGAVERREADLGVVPIENSTEGVVNSTLDVFMDSELIIVAEVVLEVSHCLLTRSGGLAGVQKVYSHPQALAQCRRWLAENLREVALIEVTSTAHAARLAKDEPVSAAVASELAASLYDLKVARARIEDDVGNMTRFLVVGTQPSAPSGRDKTSIMVSVKDQPGVLYEILQPLASRGINLTRIESRPSRRRAWDYVFFLDVDGHASAPPVQEALAELRSIARFVKILGSYPRFEASSTP